MGEVTQVEYSDIIDKISTDELIKLIQQLPEGYRLVFNLYEIEGYTHKEIAQLLNISEGTSKSQLHKAKQFLQKLLLKFDYSTYERRR
jgi:RNA polymerase sigma-70 factor (ECF subfamily)